MIDLELTKHNFQIIKFNQYDKNYTFKIKLDTYSYVTGDIIEIQWKINNNVTIQSSNITRADNVLTVKLLREVTVDAGKGYFNVVVTNANDDSRKATFKSEFEIIANSVADGAVSTPIVVTAIEQLSESITRAEELIAEIVSNDIVEEVHNARGGYSVLEERLNATDTILEENKKNVFYVEPQITMPSKKGIATNSKKLVVKADDKNYKIVQKTNKGYVMYTLTSENGMTASSVGGTWELLRMVKATQSVGAYVYMEIEEDANNNISTLTPSAYSTQQERALFGYTNDNIIANNSNVTISSKANQEGIAVRKMEASTEAVFTFKSTSKNVANLLFLGSNGSSDSVSIYVNGILCKEFNPSFFKTDSVTQSYGIVEFNVPILNEYFVTQRDITVKVVNNSDSKPFYPICFNFKKIDDYDSEYVDNYKVLGKSSDKAWIYGEGANDYAIYDSDIGAWCGSYHGGETSLTKQITYKKTLTDNSNIPEGFYVEENLTIHQVTDINGKGTMVSFFDFNTDGTMTMKFGFNGDINCDYFYTALTCTHKNFNEITYPISKDLTNDSNGDYLVPLSFGEVTQKNTTENISLNIRFTSFNRLFIDSNKPSLVRKDNSYNKYYYGAVMNIPGSNIKNIQFEKALDFIVE